MKTLTAFFLLMLLCLSSFAQNGLVNNNSTLESSFQAGVQNFLQKNPEEAKKNFLAALEKDSKNTQTIYNLSLVEAELGNYSHSLAYLKELQTLDPWYKDLDQSIEYIKKKMNFIELSNEKSYWESFRSIILIKLPFWFLNIAVILISLIFVSVMIALIKEHKKTQIWHWNIKKYLVVAVYGLIFFLFVCKWIDLNQKRATILPAKAQLHIGADQNLPVITELNAGSEVLVEEVQGDWLQVHLPGSNLGWISRSDVSVY